LRFQPAEPLAFVKECVSEGRLRWTYHVASRLGQRALTPQMLVDAFRTFEILESYPEDKYLPSYLVRGEYGGICSMR
jgi:hypothetical protein